MSNRIVEAQDGIEVLDSEEVLVDLDQDNELEEEVNEEDDNPEVEDEAKSDTEDEVVIPDKFKGKTIADVVASYENLEKEYGRRNNEIGELRKLTDQLLDLKRTENPTEEAEDNTIDADSLLENPQDAINKTLENNPTIKKLQETLTQNEIDANFKVFQDAHPDWEQVMTSPEFLTWVGKSKLRSKMLVESDRNYDYDTGSELLSDFKELHMADNTEDTADTSVEDAAKLEEDHKAISTEKKSKSKGNRKKIYKRTQIVALAVNQPEEYERRREEFDLAYQEGRVR